MDYLWTPWRFAYVSGDAGADQRGVPSELAAWQGDTGCVFCNLLAATKFAVEQGMPQEQADRAARIVARGPQCFILLNAFPYASGHVMVLPYQHVAELHALAPEAATEMMQWAQRIDSAFHRVYKPHGVNFGMNLGKAAGAGVAGHLHLHGLPRWSGDTNFMTVTSETRILPELLDDTWRKLRPELSQPVLTK